MDTFIIEMSGNQTKLVKLKLPKDEDEWKPFIRQLNYIGEKRFFVDVQTQSLDTFMRNVRYITLIFKFLYRFKIF